jgi:hypothetical protein
VCGRGKFSEVGDWGGGRCAVCNLAEEGPPGTMRETGFESHDDREAHDTLRL